MINHLRRLPWGAENGGHAYVTPGDGIVNGIADAMEEGMLLTAQEDAERATALAADPYASLAELRVAVRYLAHAVADAVKVAELRGERLPMTSDSARTLSKALRASLRRQP
ncbi:hypothetical protein [Streptomyces himalayensis]|uniref:Uncharacterized protein n=1 Tax=Streptomyces himalayensis subsp. himalayensis TaxID=2756131 RepID=A0A7W0DNQ2_9ACTN|nr:hypothetical protein [Streptomyces himalayensis]MBA2948060.1 hypothetical protein [Streptomyces himalayensis subsp. himalayensis]